MTIDLDEAKRLLELADSGQDKLRDHMRRDNDSWTPLEFGKCEGRTIPWILLHDPDYFFWAYENHAFFGMFKEVQEAYFKARSIKIPGLKQGFVVGYHVDYKNQLLRKVEVVCDWRIAGPKFAHTIYLEVLDLAVARHLKGYHKKGGKLLIRFLKELYFGSPAARLPRKVCKDFFNDDGNFDLDRDPKAELKRALA